MGKKEEIIDYYLIGDIPDKIINGNHPKLNNWEMDNKLLLFIVDSNSGTFKQNIYDKSQFKNNYIFIIVENTEKSRIIGFILKNEKINIKSIPSIIMSSFKDKKFKDIKHALRIKEFNDYQLIENNDNDNKNNSTIKFIIKKINNSGTFGSPINDKNSLNNYPLENSLICAPIPKKDLYQYAQNINKSNYNYFNQNNNGFNTPQFQNNNGFIILQSKNNNGFKTPLFQNNNDFKTNGFNSPQFQNSNNFNNPRPQNNNGFKINGLNIPQPKNNNNFNTPQLQNNNAFKTPQPQINNGFKTNGLNIPQPQNNNNFYTPQFQNSNNFNNPQPQNNKYIFPLKGLLNVGLTCYMNATLQCLLHVSELVLYFLDEYPNDWQMLHTKNKTAATHGNISTAFNELVIGVCDRNEINNKLNALNHKTHNSKRNKKFGFFSPEKFKKVIGHYNSQFEGFNANDSKDLILYLLQTMHEELNYFGDNKNANFPRPNQYDRVQTFMYFMTSYNYNNFSIISNIFYGTYEIVTKCLNCNKFIYNFQRFEFISFGMFDYKNKEFNILDGFNDNQKPNLLSGDNQFYCNSCKSLQNAYTTSQIIQPPNKLIINIDYGKNKKFKPSRIKFDETIDITKYVNFNFGTKIQYRIIGVCTHKGESGMFGHYIAYCKDRKTNEWYKFNDSQVEACSNYDIYKDSPYLLLYEKFN